MGVVATGPSGPPRFTGRVVAVTGSAGQTTTRQMVAAVLAEAGNVWSLEPGRRTTRSACR